MKLFHVAEIALIAPLAGFVLAGMGSLWTRVSENTDGWDRFSQIVTCFFMGVSLVASCFLFHQIGLGHQVSSTLTFPWIEVNQFTVSWGIRLDALTVTMMTIVSIVSFFVHIYSIGYMSHDRSIPRFMSYLSLFTFAMLALVTATNLLQAPVLNDIKKDSGLF